MMTNDQVWAILANVTDSIADGKLFYGNDPIEIILPLELKGHPEIAAACPYPNEAQDDKFWGIPVTYAGDFAEVRFRIGNLR